MGFDELESTWKKLGEDDPLWAVVTHDEKKGGRWDEKEFFETGRRDVGSLLQKIDGLKIGFERGTALDFGCGVGRLSQALCEHFQKVVGVDVASSMIERAVGFNRHPDRCEYRRNATDDLRQFPDNTFDFILSLIVLQHMHPHFAKRYLREFVRVLKPGGLLVFQMPTRRTQFYDPQIDGSFIKRLFLSLTPYPLLQMYRRARKKAVIDMFGIRQERVIALFQPLPCRIGHSEPDSMAGRGWESRTYFVIKTKAA